MASHRPPSRLVNKVLVRCLVPGAKIPRGTISKLLPSNRTRCVGVAAHKYPSGVCAKLVTILFGRPSSICHLRSDHKELVEAIEDAPAERKKRPAKSHELAFNRRDTTGL